MQKNGPVALLFHTLVVSFVLAPLVVICLVAFTPENTLSIPTTSFSLRWFRAIFEHPDFVSSFVNSLWLATLAATLSVAISVPAALAIDRYDFPGRNALNALFLSPLIIPHLVLGVAFLRLFALIGGTGSVTVCGEVTKIDMVSSSKLLMKASSQPPVMPGRIIGAVTRRNTVKCEAPSVIAACSAERSSPVKEAITSRST